MTPTTIEHRPIQINRPAPPAPPEPRRSFGHRLVLTWREAFELAMATDNPAGRRTDHTLNSPEKSGPILDALLGHGDL